MGAGRLLKLEAAKSQAQLNSTPVCLLVPLQSLSLSDGSERSRVYHNKIKDSSPVWPSDEDDDAASLSLYKLERICRDESYPDGEVDEDQSDKRARKG